MFEFVDIETTSYCNARCAFCNRTHIKFEQKHLDIEVIKKLPFENIKHVLLLGNKGDCIFYPDLFDLIEYIMENFKSWVTLHTNASAHDDKWWMELAKLLGSRGDVIYALDGLEDTHSLYRVGTNFNKIVKNITAFNKVGGKSLCQFLKFKHNEHQVDQLKKLVKDIGSTKLWVRQSRSYNDKLQRPKGAKTRHEMGKESKSTIDCVFLNKPSFVLTVDGEVRPCCFMADDDYKNNFKTHITQNVHYPQHIINYLRNPESINLKNHTFDEIMDSRYYMWIRKNYKHLYRCKQKCKVNFYDIVNEECL
jgi:MoaA/NifB/PqqE/SkfB family radical SAM enzyme